MRISVTKNISEQMLFQPGETILRGETGEIVEIIKSGKHKRFKVKLDSKEKAVDLFEDEIYFSDHKDGYNQSSCQ